MKRVGTKEIPDNTNSDYGNWIDSINKEFGLNREPYCAMGVSVSSKNVTYPKLWSALALNLKKYNSHNIKEVVNKVYIPKQGDLIVFNYGNGKGHVDIVIAYDSINKTFLLVGANRSNAVRTLKIGLNELILRKARYVVNVIPIYPKEVKKLSYRFDTSNIHVTWYGNQFHSKRTANGEKYDTTKYTAAHKTLKFGTLVKVIYKNKSVIVRINDRCLRKNTLDVTPIAIRKLGISSAKCLMVIRYEK